MSNKTTQQQLEAILTAVEDASDREDTFNHFYALDPLQFAKLLHALSLPDAVKAQLLGLKVGQPQPYKGVDLEPLIENAMKLMWSRLAEQADVSRV
jgi:hypothetical protein